MSNNKLAVIGFPIAHSLSPQIHNYWIEKYAIDASYEKIEVSEDILQEKVKGFVDRDYKGFNVTVPLKEKIKTLVDEIDPSVEAIGAINTVEIKDKKLKAYNTDAYGFIQNIKESSSIDLKGKNIVILGAGGATRAAIYGFKKEEVASITLVNRTESKARELADFFSDVQVQSWDKRENCLSNCDLLVNTTSLGMKNKAELEISLDNLPQKAAVYDIVYNPLKTKLLLEAEARGNEIIDGIGMLIHQAALAFSIWFGVMPESDKALKEKLLKLL